MSSTHNNGIVKAKHFNELYVHKNDRMLKNMTTSMEDRQKINDFLELYYYAVICYSNKCFKTYSNKRLKNTWTLKYKTFDYNLCDEYDSGTIMIKLQKKMNKYRSEYDQRDMRYEYYTEEKKMELLKFVNDGIYELIEFLIPPIYGAYSKFKDIIDKYKYVVKKSFTSVKYDTSVYNTLVEKNEDSNKFVFLCCGSS